MFLSNVVKCLKSEKQFMDQLKCLVPLYHWVISHHLFVVVTYEHLKIFQNETKCVRVQNLLFDVFCSPTNRIWLHFNSKSKSVYSLAWTQTHPMILLFIKWTFQCHVVDTLITIHRSRAFKSILIFRNSKMNEILFYLNCLLYKSQVIIGTDITYVNTSNRHIPSACRLRSPVSMLLFPNFDERLTR